MKNFRFFPTLAEYREYIYTNIFTTSDFKSNPFYKGLIEFIIDNRAPIFFEQDRPEEFSHFTQYFNFVLDRGDYYKNDFVRDMYFAHDFTHMLFRNPLSPRANMTFESFAEIMNVNEWVASNETEIFTYYRIPEMREKSLDYTIMYDLLRFAGRHKKPTANEMLDFRQRIILGAPEDNVIGLMNQHPDADKVLGYLRKFRKNNAAWCKLWYENLPTINRSYSEERLTLPVLEYERILEDYISFSVIGLRQERYEMNVLKNVRSMIAMLNLPKNYMPIFFRHCKQALAECEGMVVMPEVAKEFHFTYITSKEKAGENVEKIK